MTLFEMGKNYSRKDIYRVMKVPPEQQDGNWNTGYNFYNKDYYIFANINTSGRTGHNYHNRFIGNDLEWSAKNGSKLYHDSIKKMLYPTGNIYIFVREDSNNPYFIYIGNGSVKEYFDETPVRIIWRFKNVNESHLEILPEEILEDKPLFEGAKKQIIVNAYERNPVARQRCLNHFGYTCYVCDFNFDERYVEVGKDYIHVHHLRELSEINEEYEIDPIMDLRPVCPNCHAMLHRKKPALTIEELKDLLK